MQVKVCGLKYAEQVNHLDRVADYLGFIFYERSPRFVGTPPPSGKAKRVGVFVNSPKNFVLDCIIRYRLDCVQLHGEESPKFCRELNSFTSVIKVFSVDEQFDFRQTDPYMDSAHFFLFDTKTANYGGSGVRFDWSILQKYTGSLPFFLSGGIGPEHLEEIAHFRHPKLKGIDINSQFELKPAVKDLVLCSTFIDLIKTSSYQQ